MANRLILVRHATPGPDCAGRFIGSSDPNLDPAGLLQARALAASVRRFAPGRSYCSPRVRCRQTAAAIVSEQPVTIDDDLREIDFGRWENRRFEEVSAAEPEAVGSWAAFAPDFVFPGGEALAGFFARVSAAADRLAADDVDTVLAVAHGGVIRAMICHLLGLERRHYVLFEIDYAALVVLRLFNGRGVLVFPSGGVPSGNPCGGSSNG